MRPMAFNYLYCFMIVGTLAGGLGGSFQPARILAAGIGFCALFFARGMDVPGSVLRQALVMVLTFVFFGIVSLSWSPDVLGGVGLVLAVALGGLTILGVSRLDLGPSGVRLLVWAWVAAVALSMPIAFYEILAGVHFQYALDGRNLGGVLDMELPFAAIFFGNYNDFSTWLSLAFPITMAAFFVERKVYLRIFIALVNVLLCVIIFINTSRGCLAYISLVILFYFIKYPTFRIYGAIFAVAASPVIVSLLGDGIFDIYTTAVYKFQIASEIDESYIQRSGLLYTGFSALLGSLGLGIGAGGFEEYIADTDPYLIPNPHNILLEIGVNFGIIPLVLFIALFIRLFFISIRPNSIYHFFRLPVMLATFAVPIVGIVPSQAIGYIYWWVWLGTILAMASIKVNSKGEVYSQPKSRVVWNDREFVK